MPVMVGADPCRIRFGYWIERVRAGQDVVATRRGRPMIRLTAALEAAAPGLGSPARTYPSRSAATEAGAA
jgi:antitoxin (DNA-binding transcriptional repressor) of toxin-antitoxin stability system